MAKAKATKRGATKTKAVLKAKEVLQHRAGKAKPKVAAPAHHLTGKLSPKATGHGPVYELRQKLQLTQTGLAARLECGVATVQRCEANGTAPSNVKSQRLFWDLYSDTPAKGRR